MIESSPLHSISISANANNTQEKRFLCMAKEGIFGV